MVATKVWLTTDLAIAAHDLWERQPSLQKMVIKLNEGISGEGNALLELPPMIDVAASPDSYSDRIVSISNSFATMRFQGTGETWANFSQRIPELGAIVEAFVSGGEISNRLVSKDGLHPMEK